MKPEALDTEIISRSISNHQFGRYIEYKKSAASTNDIAKQYALSQSQLPMIIFAEKQTGGKGRMKRSWFSPRNAGIWFSVIFPPNHNPVVFGHYNFFMSLVLASAIESITQCEIELKWPNDILIKGKKVCGILSEVVTRKENSDIVITGAGLNVNLEENEFPKELCDTATSLSIESGETINRTYLFIEILSTLNTIYDLWEQRGIEPIFHSWLQKCSTIGKSLTLNLGSRSIDGTAQHINLDGSLVLQDANGYNYTVYAGDLEYSVRVQDM